MRAGGAENSVMGLQALENRGKEGFPGGVMEGGPCVRSGGPRCQLLGKERAWRKADPFCPA